MGCRISKASVEETPVRSFRVLSIPATQPKTDSPKDTPKSSLDDGSTSAEAHLPVADTTPSPPPTVELPPPLVSPEPFIYQSIAHQYTSQLQPSPTTPLHQNQYCPYRPGAHVACHSHQRPLPTPLQRPQLAQFYHHPQAAFSAPAATPTRIYHYHGSTLIPIDPPITFSVPPPSPKPVITYPPIPHVPNGSSLEDVLAPKGKRRKSSFRESGRTMSVLERSPETGDSRLSMESRRSEARTVVLASVQTRITERMELRRARRLRDLFGRTRVD
ncbi:MAG: hypothetical protein Q9181_005299 [Wetmoreana brouardii]